MVSDEQQANQAPATTGYGIAFIALALLALAAGLLILRSAPARP